MDDYAFHSSRWQKKLLIQFHQEKFFIENNDK